jgi:SAM-dependent methyltransferase
VAINVPFRIPTVAERAHSFGQWAGDYDRYRPGYPDELFATIQRRLALPGAPRVADLGAGTGRASIAMARFGWHVTAVEPSAAMLEAMRMAVRDSDVQVATIEGSAEATGLPDSCVDLVTAAQAFHWFDEQRAVPEMARIIRPGGGAALFWNVRDEERSTFLAAYAELLERHLPGEVLERGVPADRSDAPDKLAAGGWFEVDDRIELQHQVDMTPDDFVGLAFTSSYVRGGLNEAGQERFRDELRALIDQHATDGQVAVPYHLDLWIGRRTERPPQGSASA